MQRNFLDIGITSRIRCKYFVSFVPNVQIEVSTIVQDVWTNLDKLYRIISFGEQNYNTLDSAHKNH